MRLTRRALLAGIGGAAWSSAAAQRGPRRPNVIFVLTDDHGAWAMGPWGCADLQTPHLARLAGEGARFSEAFASTPVCSPSRMTYMTGKLPSAHGVQDFLLPKDGAGGTRFLNGQVTIAEVLAQNGYATGVCGKWHMGDDGQPHAGFSHWRTTAGGGGPYRNPEFFEGSRKVKRSGFKTDLTTDYALEFIEQNKERPFFLFMPYNAPHTPFDFQPEADRKPYQDSTFPCYPDAPGHPQRRWSFEKMRTSRESKISYSALVTGVDNGVGRMVKRLEELGLRENTVIVFTADQGWNAGHHGVWGKGNATIPFNMYEESIRVPLIWNHPGRIAGGQVLGPMVSSYDFFPTLLDYLGVAGPALDEKQRVGRSYAGFLRGQPPASWREELYFEFCFVRSIRTKTLKYVERSDNWGNEFFDLEADPGETVNRIGDRHQASQVAELRRRMVQFFEGVGAPPLSEWRGTTRQAIPIDNGYYDGWQERPRKD